MAGMSNKEIARDLDLGVGTVKNSCCWAFSKPRRQEPCSGCGRWDALDDRATWGVRSFTHSIFEELRHSVQRGYLAMWPCGGVVREHFVPAGYSVAVRRNRKPSDSWRWEIYRAGKSIPVERSQDYFQTMAAATRAGKAALQQLVKYYAVELTPSLIGKLYG